jgi:parvulin-like peptidyl-prolyl isomerase
MFGTIRRHQTWLWAIIIVPMIISFVMYFNPASRSGGGILGTFKGRSGVYGSIGGQPITEEQYRNAYRDVTFPLAVRGMQLPDSEQADVKHEIYIDLFLASKAEQLGIRPTAEAAARLAQNVLHGAISYDDFVDKSLKPAGLTADDFDRFLRREAAKEQLQMLAGLNGRLVTPGEAETLYRAEHRALATKFVWFPASNQLQAVKVTPDAVAQFYTNELATYRVPDQVQVNYVRFDASNYFAATKAAMTNLDQQVEDLYAHNGTNMFPQAKTPEEAKAMAKKELIRIGSLKSARRDAFGLADELDKLGNHADDLEKLAKEKGLTLYTTAPFDEETGPADLGLTNDLAAAFARDAFRLTADMPFNHEFNTGDAAYVMGLKNTIPSAIPPFKEIEARVTSDYREAHAYELAAQAATNFTTAVAGELNVNNGVTLPKTFTDICNETGNKAVTLPPFSLSTTNLPPELADRVDLQTLKRAGFSTTVGAASPPVNVQGGTFVLFVEKMLPVDETQLKDGVAEYLAMLRRQRQSEAFQLWVNYEVQQDPDLLNIFKKLSDQMRETATASPQSTQ